MMPQIVMALRTRLALRRPEVLCQPCRDGMVLGPGSTQKTCSRASLRTVDMMTTWMMLHRIPGTILCMARTTSSRMRWKRWWALEENNCCDAMKEWIGHARTAGVCGTRASSLSLMRNDSHCLKPRSRQRRCSSAHAVDSPAAAIARSGSG